MSQPSAKGPEFMSKEEWFASIRHIPFFAGIAIPEAEDPKEECLRGPVAFAWLSMAASLPGKALHLAVLIAKLLGETRGTIVKVNLSRLSDFGLSRSAATRALDQLEDAKLIEVVRRPGACPRVSAPRWRAR